ncbi:MAG: PAS domain S-box protein [Anaerolineae bacterium]|nr:PAS domain S-box protein [Anaerolineae bacterium]
MDEKRTQPVQAQGDSDERFRVAFANATIGFAMTDPAGRFIDANPAFCAITGYSLEELRTFAFPKLIHPEDRAANVALVEQMLAGKIPNFVIENRYVRKNGDNIWVRKSVSLVRSADHTPRWMIALVENITERKQAEQALAESEEQYRSLVTQAVDGIFIADSAGRFIDANSAGTQILGYTLEELTKLTITDVVAAVEVLRLPKQFDKLARGDVVINEWEFLRKDGSTFPGEVVGWQLPDGRLLGILRDITKRKQVELDLMSELDAMTQLQKLGMLSVQEGNLEPVLTEVVDVAIAISGADFGNIQMLNQTSGDLQIVAHRGFPSSWIAFWNSVTKGKGVCGTALELGERIIVEDVEQSPLFLGTPALDIQRQADVRAVQSTPLVSRSGKTVGMFSTHYRTPTRPDHRVLRMLDLLARQAADIIEQVQAEAALRESETRQAFLVHLADTLRSLTDPVEIEATIKRMVGEHLDVARVWLVLIHDDGTLIVERDYVAKDASSVAGRYHTNDFTAIVDALREGRSFVVRDMAGEPRLSGNEWTVIADLLFKSFIGAPIFSNGKLVAMLGVGELTARDWTGAEVRLVEEAAKRAWPDMQRARAQQALRASEERQAFLLRLSDMLRPLADPTAIQAEACRLICEHLQADRAFYVEFYEGKDYGRVRYDYQRGNSPSVVGQHKLADYGWMIPFYRAGQTINVTDTTTSALIPEAERSALAAIQITALLSVPLVKNGVLVGNLTVSEPKPRSWTQDEVELVQETGERTWAAVERGRAEEALRQMNEELEQLVADRTAELRATNKNLEAEIIERKKVEAALRQSKHFLEGTLVKLKETQKQMLHQERLAAVGQLAAGVAHDFNNILIVILGFAELLHQSPDTPEIMQSSLQRISTSAQRAARLVRQLLDFSQKTVRQPQYLELDVLLQEHITFLERLIPENIALMLNIASRNYGIEADATQLQQVITNLVVNARDSMPAGGKLEISLARLETTGQETCAVCRQSIIGEWLFLTVADNGVGMAAETVSYIFEPFFTTKDVGQGTGLGLAQVAGIVAQHSGHITVNSQVDRGTTFTVYLPSASKKNDGQSTESQPIILSGQNQTILLVEDEPAVVDIIKAMLEHLHYRVITAGNGHEALAIYKEHQTEIVLVLSDMVMPDMDGEALLQALTAENANLKMVLMSGYPLGKKGPALLAQGITAWIEKPISFGQLSQVISKALSNKPGRWR